MPGHTAVPEPAGHPLSDCLTEARTESAADVSPQQRHL
jgi:hypothetical protein